MGPLSWTGTLPDTFAAWNLTHLSLANNNLTGTLPALWGASWPYIKFLDVTSKFNSFDSAQFLSGPIPDTWGTQDGLSQLYYMDRGVPCTGLGLSHNNVSGPLPQALIAR